MRIPWIAPLHEAVPPNNHRATYRRLGADERPATWKRLQIINSGNGLELEYSSISGRGYGMNALRKSLAGYALRSNRLRNGVPVS
jgi:hypothetical protein